MANYSRPLHLTNVLDSWENLPDATRLGRPSPQQPRAGETRVTPGPAGSPRSAEPPARGATQACGRSMAHDPSGDGSSHDLYVEEVTLGDGKLGPSHGHPCGSG